MALEFFRWPSPCTFNCIYNYAAAFCIVQVGVLGSNPWLRQSCVHMQNIVGTQSSTYQIFSARNTEERQIHLWSALHTLWIHVEINPLLINPILLLSVIIWNEARVLRSRRLDARGTLVCNPQHITYYPIKDHTAFKENSQILSMNFWFSIMMLLQDWFNNNLTLDVDPYIPM